MPSRPPRLQMAAKGVARQASDRRHDAKRSNREYRAWYKSPAWRKIRAAHLAIEPLCRRCRANGVLNDGTRKIDGSYEPDPKRRGLVVNHEGGHGGDAARFWSGPFETSCKAHHDGAIQREEAAARKAAAR